MNKVRKVHEYWRKPDGTYERIEPEASIPRPCESNESKRLRKLAACGNMVCRVKNGKQWAELRLVSAGTYAVGGERITAPDTYIVVTKSEAFWFDSQRYARELGMWRQGIDDCQ